MRIRRRPPQIPAADSADPAAEGDVSGGERAEEAVAVGSEAGKGETIMGTGRLHPSIEARGEGGRPWRGESASGWRLGHPGGGGQEGRWTSGDSDGSCHGKVQQLNRQKGKAEEDGDFGAKGEEEHQKPPDAAAAHSASGHSSAAASTNGLATDALLSATVNSSCIEHGGATGKKNAALSNGSSRSSRPPSLSYVKAEITNRRVRSYMHGIGDHDQVVKGDDTIKGEEQQPLVHDRGNSGNSNKGGKRRRSPAVLMEGSRCSRVNGRGWRCSQQTLVGYSLCEHHLGKGRLRSISSVKCKKAGGVGGKQPRDHPVSAVQQHDKLRSLAAMALNDDDDDEDYEEAKPAVEMKRRKRIGTVKARSMSSLLGQMSSDVINHAEVVQPEVAPMITIAMTLAGLSSAAFRSPVESNTTPAAATVLIGVLPESTAATTAAASLPPTIAARQEGISAVIL